MQVTRVRSLALMMIVVAGLSSCSGDQKVTTPPPPPPPPAGVLLKDVVIPNLPSPYYHFEYDSQGMVSSVSFASGLTTYAVTYAGARISELRNNTVANHDRLVYVYDDAGRVAAIRETDESGVIFTVKDRFEQYDDGLNVDAFGLIHDDFFDHLVLLPAVQLQKSNPRRVTRTGDADNYTYTYDARTRPLTTRGDLTFTTGSRVGQHFQVGSLFSYYD